MTFQKGVKFSGRPKGAVNKYVFNVVSVINARFPASIPHLADRVSTLDSAKASPGRDYLKKYYSGGKLSARQAAIAQCCSCMGYYSDGKIDCECPICSLYPFMPYRLKDK